MIKKGIVLVIAAIIFVGCSTAPVQGEKNSGSESTSAVTVTEAMIASETPSPTGTPEPTATEAPTATIEPPQPLMDLFEGLQFTSVDDFENLNNWECWPDSNVMSLEDGILKHEGRPGWTSGVTYTATRFEEGEGFVFRFKYLNYREANFSFNIDNFGTDTYKDWDTNIAGSLNAGIWKGKNYTSLGAFQNAGRLKLTKDTWFNLAQAVGKNGTFVVRIWDDADPPNVATKYYDGKRTGESWIGQNWSFYFQGNRNMVIFIDDFRTISFDDIMIK